jgi:hypothetical protein
MSKNGSCWWGLSETCLSMTFAWQQQVTSIGWLVSMAAEQVAVVGFLFLPY